MNRVDFLLENPFHGLDLPAQLLIKKLGPHQPNVKINQSHKTQTRNFNIDWYRRKPWLTASESRTSLYCFYCLLFGGEYPWTRDGVRDLKHLSERVKTHETSPNHIGNCLKIALFGKETFLREVDDGQKLSIRQHNEMVDKNKYILNKVIDCLKFCGSHNISLNFHEGFVKEKKNETFLNIFNEFSNLNIPVHERSQSEAVLTYTSDSVLKELLICIYYVYKDILKEKINEAMFVSVQIDETSDRSSSSQLFIILRFVMGTELVEKFHGFVDLHARSSPNDKAASVLREIEGYELRDKLVAYSHDTNTYKQISDTFPCSCFVHCYAHELTSIVQNICCAISPVKIFFANLHLFYSFFAQSPKRVQMINDTCEELGFPLAIVSIENFERKLATTVEENVPALLRCFEKINNEPGWDIESIGIANALSEFLKDKQFTYFLEFFSEITHVVEYLFSSLQNCITNQSAVNPLLHFFYTSMKDIRKKVQEIPDEPVEQPLESESKRAKIQTNKTCALECCDLIVDSVKSRFEAKDNLACFELVDPAEFKNFKNGFPKDISYSIKFYPSLDEEKLKNEVRVLYDNENITSIKTCNELYTFLCENGLQTPFSESSRLLNISLTTPIVTSQPERRFSSLTKIQNYLANTRVEERSDGLAVLSIENDFIKKVTDFNERVILKFAEQRNTRSELIYK